MSNTLKLGNGKWATGKDTLLSFSDTNNNYKPLPFSFSRDSSGTVINKDGLIETVGSGEPRIDFKDNTKGSLLLEPTRSNVAPYSEDFSNSGWTKNNTTVTSGFTSPDGTNNAYLMTDDATDSRHGVYDLDVLSQDGNIYTRSVFVKKGTARYVVLSARHLPTSSGTSWIYDFDINNWILIGSTGVGQSIEDYGNGWIRLSISHISDSNFNNDFSVGISTGSTISDTSYSGSGDTLYIYAAQVEQGSYATSYIPTSGGVVTRSADSSSQTVPDGVIGQTEGTMFVDVCLKSLNTLLFIITSSVGNEANRLQLWINASGQIVFYRGDGSVSITSSTIYEIGDNLKIAGVYKSNDFELFINGVSIGADTSGTLPPTPSVLYIGQYVDGNTINSSSFKEAKLYNTRLSNSELATLTS